MRLHEVAPRLFMRGHFEKNKDKISSLNKRNISLVVCLLDKFDTDLPEAGISLVSYPLTDGKYVDEPVVKSAVTEVVRALESGLGVLVHCRGGKNRAGLVVTLSMMQFWGLAPTAALRWARAVRPKAVSNPVFEEYILAQGDV